LGLSENTKLATIEYLAIHPDFEKDGIHLNHDIAILRTEQEIVWKKTLSPICLPAMEIKDYGETGSNVTVAGWGAPHCPAGN